MLSLSLCAKNTKYRTEKKYPHERKTLFISERNTLTIEMQIELMILTIGMKCKGRFNKLMQDFLNNAQAIWMG